MIKLWNEPMSKHTTYRFGGKADHYIIAENPNELKDIMKSVRGFLVFIIGNGSNLIVRDEGFRGVIIEPVFRNITVKGNIMTVEAGASAMSMIAFANKNRLKGLECITGIPGRLGGMICMNAGYTKPIGSLVQSVRVMDYNGNITRLSQKDMQFGYRSSIIQQKKWVVISADLVLQKGDSRTIVADYLKKRKATQPIQYASCGTVFKRGSLEEYQELQRGDAKVIGSYIVNLGKATAHDVLSIIVKIQAEKGYELEAEIIGG